ncbi:MAG TPA: hypothetical protein VN397_02810 [Candidatus Methylomirabilis sp.]|nr:hypothetical protein [Candidatus Methylomirabilis sp.]
MKRQSTFIMALGLFTTLGIGCNPFQSAKDKISEKIGEKVVENVIEKAIKKDSGKNVDVDLQKGGFSFKDEKTGQVFAVGEGVKIPDSFPSDVPRYPGATPKSVSLVDEQQEAGMVLETSDALEKVASWYKSEAQKSGWKSASTFNSEQTNIMSFEKEENGGTAKFTVSVSGNQSSDGNVMIIVARNGVKKE